MSIEIIHECKCKPVVAELVAALDHPLLRHLFGEIEDSGSPEAQKLWAYAMAWFDVRDAAIAKAKATP